MRNDTHLPHIKPDDWDHIIIPVSGGKDSQAILHLALKTPGLREKLTVVHQATGYDHSLTMLHLAYMSTYYGVKILSTQSHKYADIFDLIRKERYFPSSLARNCTSLMKIKPFASWLHDRRFAKKKTLVLLGMRGAESASRNEQYADLAPSDYFSICDISKDYQKRLKPISVNLGIVDWSTNEVFDYLAAQRVKVNPLYKRGHKRVGCYPCLLAGDQEWKLAARDAEGRRNIKTLIDIQAEFAADKVHVRKLIKIHPTRDVAALLKEKPDPFGFSAEEDQGGCALCDM